MTQRNLPQPWQVVWKEEKRVLRLGKEPVLSLELSWPEIQRGGRGGRRVSQYYRKVVQTWNARWEKTLYCRACLALAASREKGQTFSPWSARLEGQVTFQDGENLSIVLDAWEDWGDGRPLQVRTADLWTVPDARPLSKGRCWPEGRARRQLFRELAQQGQARRDTGDCFLDPDFAKKLPRALSWRRCARTDEGLEYYAPQGVLAVPVEGVVTFRAPVPPPPGKSRRKGKAKESGR